MSLDLRMYIDGQLAPQLSFNPSVESTLIGRGDTQLLIRDISQNISVLEETVGTLFSQNLKAWAVRLSLRNDGIGELGPWVDEEELGYVIGPADFESCLNPVQDFVKYFGANGHGLLKHCHPLLIGAKPTGHFVTVGWCNTAMSRIFCDFLSQLGTVHCHQSDVFVGDRILKSWVRVEFISNYNVLDGAKMQAQVCLQCRQPTLESLGIYFGIHRIQESFCVEQLGTGHGGCEHPLVVTSETAFAIKERFPEACSFEPIFSSRGYLASQVSLISEAIAVIKGTHRQWEQSPHLSFANSFFSP